MSLTAGSLLELFAYNTTSLLSSGVASSGSTPYAYQWYRSTFNGFTPSTANIVSGATALTLSDSNLAPATTYYYKVVVTDSNGTPAHSTSSQITVVTRAGLNRVTSKIFGSNSGANQIEEFGSFANGAAIYSTDPAAIQSLSNWLTGWFAAVIGGYAPTIEDMNAVCYVLSYLTSYLYQMGIPEWDSGTTYQLGSLVNASGAIYSSLSNNNTNNPLSDSTNWGALGSQVSFSYSDNSGAALNSGFNKFTYNTKQFDPANAYSNGVFTAPIGGTYFFTAGLAMTSFSWITIGENMQLRLNKNASLIFARDIAYNWASGISAALDVQCNGLVKLNQGDTVQVDYLTSVSTSAVTTADFNWFSGYRIGA